MAWFDLDADRKILELHRALRNGRYRPRPWTLRVIADPKVRIIAAPAIRDRIVQRALLDEIGPAYEQGYRPEHFAQSQAKGPLRACLTFLRLQRRHRHRVHLDVRRYFASIHLPTLRRLMFRRLRDPCTRQLIDRQLASHAAVYESPLAVAALDLERAPLPTESGLSLGSYLSQWAGAFYLDGLDHHVKRELKAPGYVRYTDDFVLFDDDAGRLREARAQIAAWLQRERGLELNRKRWHVVPNREPAVFLGYRISRAGVSASRKLRRRLDARLRVAAAQSPAQLERVVASYRGLLCF